MFNFLMNKIIKQTGILLDKPVWKQSLFFTSGVAIDAEIIFKFKVKNK